MTKNRIKILFADDHWEDNNWDEIFNEDLVPAGVDVDYESHSDKVLQHFRKDSSLQLLLLDIMFENQEMQGENVLEQMQLHFPHIPVIILSSVDSVSTALKYVQKKGAYYYFTKNNPPLNTGQLVLEIQNAVSHYETQLNSQILEDEVKGYRRYEKMVGGSLKMKALYETIDNIALTPNTTVLILGETGTGKELVARAIHERSARKDKPFIAINCGAIPKDLLEDELFGHEKGAFTGAHTLRRGKFELASGGALFLDEIAELDPALQVKLLRALQEKEIERIGSSREPIKVDVRIIAATNRELEKDIQTGKFREDLYYRINIMPIKTYPLRERTDDIPALVDHIIRKLNQRMARAVKGITKEAMKKLMNYSWPGNIRELENCLERAFVLSMGTGEVILEEKLFPALEEKKAESEDFSGNGAKEYCHRLQNQKISLDDIPIDKHPEVIKMVLRETHGNGRKAAEIMGINYDTLRKRFQKWGIKSMDYR